MVYTEHGSLFPWWPHQPLPIYSLHSHLHQAISIPLPRSLIFMSTLVTGLTLAIASKRNIVVTTDNPDSAVNAICRALDCAVVDISTEPFSCDATVTVWTHLQDTNDNLQRQLYNQIRLVKRLGIIVAVLHVKQVPLAKLYPYLKEQFWFSIYEKLPTATACVNWEEVQRIRESMPLVFVSPDIKRYIYSLVIFTRQHRMASLAPKSVRLATTTIDDIRELAVALCALRFQTFVNPSVVKLAYKRVAYWRVDWEVSPQRNDNKEITEMEKRYRIVTMVGDWYGSDYEAVREYIEGYFLKLKPNSPTGWSNRIVDDVLTKVRPPI